MSIFKDILRKFGLETDNIEKFNILVTSLKVILRFHDEKKLNYIQNIDAPLLSCIKKLNDNEINYLEEEMVKNDTSIEECQIRVQRLLAKKKRKEFAAYYTTDEGTNLMALLVEEYIKLSQKNDVIIADPFMGSGRTLTITIKKIGIENIKQIWGIEPYALSAMVGYAALLKTTNGKDSLIKVISGDTFIETSKNFLIRSEDDNLKADIVLTNPPFTRWENIEINYRKTLVKIIDGMGYSKYITKRDTSLQILCMFLVDNILKKNGLLVSVLPASTFYTIYGRGYKNLLRENYHLLSFLESGSQSSFSIDSGFKEVIIVGLKKKVQDTLTIFTKINGIDIQDFAQQLINYRIDILKQNKNHYLINIKKLAQFLDNNWLSLVGNKDLKKLIIDTFYHGIETELLGYWNNILGRRSLIRGIEMYGPDFFFIKNKYWDIIEDNNNHVKIENKERNELLTIDKKYLVRTLRKPSLYNYTIFVDVDTYMVSIPPKETNELPEDLKIYINWGKDSNTAKPAIKKHDKYWYSHVYNQIQSKDPFGEIFITDKVDLGFTNRGVFANYSDKKLAASKNFYIVKNIGERYSILLTAWFNSTIFMSILILFSRKISDTWTRFLLNDYLEVPVLNMAMVSDDLYKEISDSLFNILHEKLPPFWDQLGEKFRYNLDLAILKALKIKNPEHFIKKLYAYLNNYINNSKIQNRKL